MKRSLFVKVEKKRSIYIQVKGPNHFDQPIDFLLFLFSSLVEFDEFYRIKKISMDSEHHYSRIPFRIHG